MPRAKAYLLTCEHGGNRIPAPYKHLFQGQEAVLASHRGLDIGALAVAKMLARRLKTPLIYAETSRLLIDLNRSLGHSQLFSEFSAGLTEAERRRVQERYYHPYREQVAGWIKQHAQRGLQVIHLSLHSFTPVLHGDVRQAELGYLYDPRRLRERQWAEAFQRATKAEAPSHGWRIRRNYPYHGASDGLTTALRQRFSSLAYLGLELEMNQAVTAKAEGQRLMAELFSKALLAQR